MLTVLVPLAGDGRRFRDRGYALPKPLIDVSGAPVIARVLRCVGDGLSAVPHRLVFLVRNWEVRAFLEGYRPGSVIVPVDGPTEGAACTCLLARDHIDTGAPLLVVNGDQLVSPEAVRALVGTDADGAILTMHGDGSKKWSYVVIGEGGEVLAVWEKEPLSDRATCGLYHWKRGSDFVASAGRMIEAGDRVNGEFYVAPVYNHFAGTVREVRIEDHGGVFVGLGTPDDLETYLGTLG